MHRSNVSATPVALLGLGLALMAPLQPAHAFGDDGELPGCTSFTTCSAAIHSSATGLSQYTFTSVHPAYPVPAGLHEGVNTSLDHRSSASSSPVVASSGSCTFPPCLTHAFVSHAIGSSQTDFGVNRARADTGAGASGTDDVGSGVTADVKILTVADAGSAWRDVWRFSADGHFNATIALDGHSSAASGQFQFPSSFDHVLASPSGDWFYDLKVWDVDHMSPDADGFPGPTLVGSVRDRTGNGESRSSFASTLALDFDFMAGVQYVVTSVLGANARNGRDIDLYNTVKMTDVLLSGNATMSTLSGHDYLAPPTPAVPEPQTTALLAAGLALLGIFARRKRRF